MLTYFQAIIFQVLFKFIKVDKSFFINRNRFFFFNQKVICRTHEKSRRIAFRLIFTIVINFLQLDNKW